MVGLYFIAITVRIGRLSDVRVVAIDVRGYAIYNHHAVPLTWWVNTMVYAAGPEFSSLAIPIWPEKFYSEPKRAVNQSELT